MVRENFLPSIIPVQVTASMCPPVCQLPPLAGFHVRTAETVKVPAKTPLPREDSGCSPSGERQTRACKRHNNKDWNLLMTTADSPFINLSPILILKFSKLAIRDTRAK